MNYYNENDSFAASWLRNLISAGLIPQGYVDDRSIKDVQADDLKKYTQCHFFAGIGGWSEALRLAEWPAEREVWTGSCPCQPFSAAGKRKGADDERHLWPEFYRLIAQCRPAVCFGEQVASADGREWLTGVRADLERVGYAVGAADLCAAGVRAPDKRQRLWWVADAYQPELRRESSAWQQPEYEQNGGTSELADAGSERCWPRGGRSGSEESQGRNRSEPSADGKFGRLADSSNERGPEYVNDTRERARIGTKHAANCGGAGGMGDAGEPRLSLSEHQKLPAPGRGQEGRATQQSSGSRLVWADARIIECRDGRSRRISAQPGDEPLAYGIPVRMGRGRSRRERMGIRAARANRVGRLRGYGNAICPQVAAEFIAAYLEATSTEAA